MIKMQRTPQAMYRDMNTLSFEYKGVKSSMLILLLSHKQDSLNATEK